MGITKYIHRIWLGPREMPEKYKEFGELWAKMNPDYDIILWDYDRCITELTWNQDILNDIYQNGPYTSIAHDVDVAKATQAADILSVELLYKYGGVYTNCDIEPLRPLDGLPEGAWAAYEINHWLNNGVMGTDIVNDPFFYDLDEFIYDRFWSEQWRGYPMHQVTGPWALTEFASGRDDFTPLPRESFHLAGYDDVPLGGDAAPFRDRAIEAGAYGLHHWNHRSKDARTDIV